MRRSTWINVLLGLVVAALAAWVYFKPAPVGPAEHPLAALEPSSIESIVIERPGEPTIAAQKKQDAWFVTAPIAARGNETRIQQVLEIANARSAHRYPAADLGRFELAPAQTRLTLGRQS